MNSNFKQFTLRAAMFAALAGFGIAAQAVEGTASATAGVITPISITKAADLNFGKFARGAGGSVTVSTSGARTASGTVLSTIGSAPTAARFNVGGDNNASYAITYPDTTTITLSDTATPTPNTMSMALVSDLSGAGAVTGTVASGTLSATGAQSIYVGGVLTVNAAQATGTYTGSFRVAVQYN